MSEDSGVSGAREVPIVLVDAELETVAVDLERKERSNKAVIKKTYLLSLDKIKVPQRASVFAMNNYHQLFGRL